MGEMSNVDWQRGIQELGETDQDRRVVNGGEDLAGCTTWDSLEVIIHTWDSLEVIIHTIDSLLLKLLHGRGASIVDYVGNAEPRRQ
jgi:hypothetical protein